MDDWLPSQTSRPRRDQAPRGTMTTDRPADGTRSLLNDAPPPRGRPARLDRPVRRVVRRDIMIRRVDPWSVLKISVVFYLCMMIIAMLANAVVWALIGRLGLIDQLTTTAESLSIALTINTGNILRATFLLGVLAVVFFTAVNVFLAFLYNLVSDLIGGVRVDLAEDE